jgi:hypothetical protein
MDVAGKLNPAKLDYGSTPEIARARGGARFGVAPSSAAVTAAAGKAQTGTAAPDMPRSAHAEQSTAWNALLEAQAQATPALERMPTKLRPRAITARWPENGETDFDAAAEAALNRLRDARPVHRPTDPAPLSEADGQEAATA